MGKDIYKGKPFQYPGIGERRRFRPMADPLFHNERIDDFPTDRKSVSMIKNNIISFSEYCYKRVNDKGYVENEMVEEFLNIALILRGYCEVDGSKLWKSDFNVFNIRFFEYLLKEGQKYDKNLVIELLSRSGILDALSEYIIQYRTYIFDSNLILDYYDTSVEAKNRNMLCFMTYQVCPYVKKFNKIKVEDLTAEELETGIRSRYFNDRKEEIGRYIKDLLISKKSKDLDDFEQFRTTILKLHLMEYLEISMYEDLLKDHDLYRIKYHPETIDYKTIKLSLFSGLRHIRIRDNVEKYGGYEIYKRLRAVYKKYPNIRYNYILGHIFANEKFKYRYCEEIGQD